MNRLSLTLAAGSLLAGGLASAPALAQPAWPSKTLRFIVPFPPGGGTDLISNLRIAHKQCNILKGDLVPENDFDVPMREPRPPRRKKEIWRSEIMARFCDVCENGRKLGPDDICNQCGSLPGPAENPRYLKRRAPDCDHSSFWCWACSIGIVEKRPAMIELITGG